MRLEPTISTLTAICSIQMANRDRDGYRIRKYISLKLILFIMFANLKLVLRSYTSLYSIFMSASLTLFSCTNVLLFSISQKISYAYFSPIEIVVSVFAALVGVLIIVVIVGYCYYKRFRHGTMKPAVSPEIPIITRGNWFVLV